MKIVVLLLGFSLLTLAQVAPDPTLNTRVLVVYNANGDGSQKVAKYYMDKRGIPKENVCKIDTDTAGFEDEARYEAEVKKPIRACLEKAGKDRILYIVLAYLTPFNTNLAGKQLAVDQQLADIWDEYAAVRVNGLQAGDQPYFAKAEAEGNMYEPFLTFAKYREKPNAKTIYSVWRLDAASVEMSKGLVDKALAAESSGLHGNAYFDIRGPIEGYVDTSYGAGEWDIYQASRMAVRAGFNTTLDDKETEFGTQPSLLRCDNAALYAGWYSLNHYNDAFAWAPGAIGFHLDSASAVNPRSSGNWVGGALQRGITVTSGSVTEPYLEGLPHPDRIFRALFEGANVGDAVLRGTRWLKWMLLNVGDPLYRPFPNGIGEYAKPHQESFFVLAFPNIVGSAKVEAQFGVVPRNESIPVKFTSNYPSLFTLPGETTLPPGATGAKFQIGVKGPLEPVTAKITITVGNEVLSNTLQLFPELIALTLNQTTVKSEGSVTGTISLAVAARGPGMTIKLSSDSPNAVVPAEVTVPVGARTVSFPIRAKTVTTDANVKITATLDDASRSAQLKLTP